MTFPENMQEQLDRIRTGGVLFTPEQEGAYLRSKDILEPVAKGVEVPLGYKRCGACGIPKKFFLFNKNSGSKTNTSGNCKDCQKKSAAKSYGKTKGNRNYKEYYQANKERKQAHARKYYQDNKEKMAENHRRYLSSAKGQRVMRRAHAKRRAALAANKGIPYTRELVIERDSKFLGFVHPICYLCNSPITDTSGAELHLDHVIPVIESGLDCFSNVGCTHRTCNLTREKDARRLTEEQVKGIINRTEAYIDAHPEKFDA